MAKKMIGKRILAAVLSLVLVCNLLPLMGAMAAENESVNTVQNFEDTYYKQDGTAGSASDWEIHLSKTATPTDEDNVFDITLKVQTKDTFTQIAGSTDGAAALVLDVSSSMVEGTGSCGSCGKEQNHSDHRGNRKVCNYKAVTHLDLLKEAVKDFLDSYVEDAAKGDKRMVAIVKFATNAETVLGWIDVNNETNLATVKNAIDAMGSTSGTNIEAGLVLGRNLLKQSAVSSIPLENQSLILFSDGSPTKAVGDVNNDSTTYVGAASGGSFYSGSNTSDDLADILAEVAAKKKAVAYNTDAELLKSVFGAANVITSTADSLAMDLAAEAGEIVTNKTNASTITDPMGTGVTMVTVTTNYNAATENWDLSKVTPVVANGITTYTITYRVQIDPTAAQLDPNFSGYTVLTPANGETTLNYTYGENAIPVSVDFNEPSIRGQRTFTVSYEYVGNVPENAPEVPADATYKAGQTVEVAAEPSLENYTFSGWSKSDFVMPAADVTIVGTWSENAKYSYALVYNANFGANETKADAENISGIYATSHTITVDDNTFVRENYTFAGWNTAADGSGMSIAPGNVVGLTAEKNTAVLYAQWIEDPKYSYSVTYNANFGANETKADSENIYNVYSTAWNINVDTNAFTRENYTFIGWNTRPDGNGTAYAANDVVALTAQNNAAVLYAQWEENEKFDYSVIYDANFSGETKADAENISGTYATVYTITVDGNTFVRENYTFLGWSDVPNGDIVYAAGDEIRFEQGGSKILYAIWREYPKYDYTVIYNGNGGLLSDGTDAYGDSENVLQTYASAYSITVDGNAFVRANYTFLGWNTAADGTGTAYTATDVLALTAEDNTLTLYAIWEENEKYDYTVIYNANFAQMPEKRTDTESVTGVYDRTWSVTADGNAFVRTGYTFAGWNTAADGTGTAYAPGDILNLTAEENVLVLYAQWQINVYAYEVVYMVRVNGEAYEVFAGTLPEGAPVGGNADFGTVIDEEFMVALGLPAELAEGEYTYSRNAFQGITVAEEGNVVTAYYTCIVEEEPPVEPVVPPVEPTQPTEPPAEPTDPTEPPVIDIPDDDVPLDESPKTGDAMGIYAALSALSGTGLVALLAGKKRTKKDEE